VNQRGQLEIKLVCGVYHPVAHVNLYEFHSAASSERTEQGDENHTAIRERNRRKQRRKTIIERKPCIFAALAFRLA
jgi:hypothetical protein